MSAKYLHDFQSLYYTIEATRQGGVQYTLHKCVDKSSHFAVSDNQMIMAKEMSDIASRVRSVIAEKLEVDESSIPDNARFHEDLGADSLDTVELVMELEREFGCTFPDEVAEEIKTVEQAVESIKEHIRG